MSECVSFDQAFHFSACICHLALHTIEAATMSMDRMIKPVQNVEIISHKFRLRISFINFICLFICLLDVFGFLDNIFKPNFKSSASHMQVTGLCARSACYCQINVTQ